MMADDENASVKIEKGVPLPEGFGRKRDYPFDKMEVGDSFWLDGGETAGQRLRNASLRYKYAGNDATFAVRKDGTGFRIWRTK